MGTVSEEAREKQRYCPGFSDLLFWESLLYLNGLLPHGMFCKRGRELEMPNVKENVCLALFFFNNFSSNRA